MWISNPQIAAPAVWAPTEMYVKWGSERLLGGYMVLEHLFIFSKKLNQHLKGNTQIRSYVTFRIRMRFVSQ